MKKHRLLSGMAFRELYHVSPLFFWICYTLTFLQGVLRIFPIITLQVFFDNLVGNVFWSLFEYIGARLLCHLMDGIMNYLYEYYDLVAAHGMEHSINEKVGKLSGIEFEKKATLETINKAYRGTTSIRKYVDTLMLLLLDCLPELLVIVFYLYRANPFLPLILALVILPIIFVSKMQGKEFAEQERLISDIQRKLDTFESFLIGVQHAIESRIYRYDGMFMHKIDVNLSQKVKVETSYLRKKCSLENLEAIILLISHTVIFVVLTLCASNKIISIGVFAALITSLGELFQIMEDIISVISEGVSENLEKVRNYFVLKQKELEKDGSEEIEYFESVRFEHVSFSYPKSEVDAIQDISFEIKKGEHIAIVGENGAGKSTFIKLLCGIYVPREGNVFFNGQLRDKYVRKSILQRFTAVFQNFGRYAMNMDDNIILGDEEKQNNLASVKQMKELKCCNDINSDVILSHEFGGIDLSGGQWQRVAIARGIYRAGEIFLLDEPTSAIDPNEESRLYHLFQVITAGKTSVLVTHRMGAVKLVDKIIVMKAGKICGIGSHDELLSTCGEYQRLWYSQAGLYKK
ncbi:MAG: ABC transporter ATP-binding protein [Agathobacter sp.]|nr:ABC transporter ATP-binding protein [Agathobacter sp.]